jgi:hypothetical protein
MGRKSTKVPTHSTLHAPVPLIREELAWAIPHIIGISGYERHHGVAMWSDNVPDTRSPFLQFILTNTHDLRRGKSCNEDRRALSISKDCP